MITYDFLTLHQLRLALLHSHTLRLRLIQTDSRTFYRLAAVGRDISSVAAYFPVDQILALLQLLQQLELPAARSPIGEYDVIHPYTPEQRQHLSRWLQFLMRQERLQQLLKPRVISSL